MSRHKVLMRKQRQAYTRSIKAQLKDPITQNARVHGRRQGLAIGLIVAALVGLSWLLTGCEVSCVSESRPTRRNTVARTAGDYPTCPTESGILPDWQLTAYCAEGIAKCETFNPDVPIPCITSAIACANVPADRIPSCRTVQIRCQATCEPEGAGELN